MPKERTEKKSPKLRHEPLGNEMEKPLGKLKVQKRSGSATKQNDDDDDDNAGYNMDMEARAPKLGKSEGSSSARGGSTFANDDDYEVYHSLSTVSLSLSYRIVCSFPCFVTYQEDDLLLEEEEEEEEGEELVEYDGDYICK